MKLKRVIQRTLVISAIPVVVIAGAAAPALASGSTDHDYKYYACAYGDDHDSYWKKYGKYWDSYAEYRNYYDKYCGHDDNHKSRDNNDDKDHHKNDSDHKRSHRDKHTDGDNGNNDHQSPERPPGWPLPDDFLENLLPDGIGSVGQPPG